MQNFLLVLQGLEVGTNLTPKVVVIERNTQGITINLFQKIQVPMYPNREPYKETVI